MERALLVPTAGVLARSTTAADIALKILLAIRLRTIHPNSRPPCRKGMRKGRSEQQRVERRKSRYKKRRKRRLGRRKNELKQITTWNLQGLSLRQNNSNRLTRVLNYMKEKRWEVLLSTEIRREREMAPYDWEKAESRQWWFTLGERPSSWEENTEGLESYAPKERAQGADNSNNCGRNESECSIPTILEHGGAPVVLYRQ